MAGRGAPAVAADAEPPIDAVTRYFVNCTAPTPTEAHEAATRHGGRVLAVRIHRGNHPSQQEWVYGWAEIELTDKETEHGPEAS